MKVSILDDYFDTLRTLHCFHKLDGYDVAVWNDHIQDIDGLAARLSCSARAAMAMRWHKASERSSSPVTWSPCTYDWCRKPGESSLEMICRT